MSDSVATAFAPFLRIVQIHAPGEDACNMVCIGHEVYEIVWIKILKRVFLSVYLQPAGVIPILGFQA